MGPVRFGSSMTGAGGTSDGLMSGSSSGGEFVVKVVIVGGGAGIGTDAGTILMRDISSEEEETTGYLSWIIFPPATAFLLVRERRPGR